MSTSPRSYYSITTLLGFVWCTVFVLTLELGVPYTEPTKHMLQTFLRYVIPFLITGLAMGWCIRKWLLKRQLLPHLVSLILLPIVGASLAGYLTGLEILFFYSNDSPYSLLEKLATPFVWWGFGLFYVVRAWYVVVPLSLLTISVLRLASGEKLFPRSTRAESTNPDVPNLQ